MRDLRRADPGLSGDLDFTSLTFNAISGIKHVPTGCFVSGAFGLQQRGPRQRTATDQRPRLPMPTAPTTAPRTGGQVDCHLLYFERAGRRRGRARELRAHGLQRDHAVGLPQPWLYPESSRFFHNDNACTQGRRGQRFRCGRSCRCWTRRHHLTDTPNCRFRLLGRLMDLRRWTRMLHRDAHLGGQHLYLFWS